MHRIFLYQYFCFSLPHRPINFRNAFRHVRDNSERLSPGTVKAHRHRREYDSRNTTDGNGDYQFV